MRLRECMCNLLQLPRRFVGTEINRRSDCDRAHVPCLLNGAVHHLVELVGVRQHLIVIELDDERNFVCPLASNAAENAKCRCDRVASTFDSKLDDLVTVEI